MKIFSVKNRVQNANVAKQAVILSTVMLVALSIQACGSSKPPVAVPVPRDETVKDSPKPNSAKTVAPKSVITPEINYRESAKQAFIRGDYKQALSLYKKHKEKTGDASVDADIAECSQKLAAESDQVCKDGIKLYLSENYDDALKHFKKALDLNESNQLASEYHKRTVDKLKALKKLDGDSEDNR
jgi:tetratricopeptide (TPR) repeat protein